MDGEGGNHEKFLKWGGGSGGSLRNLSKNILNWAVGKGKSCLYGVEVLKVSPLLPPPPEILIVHLKLKEFLRKNLLKLIIGTKTARKNYIMVDIPFFTKIFFLYLDTFGLNLFPLCLLSTPDGLVAATYQLT